MEFIRRGRWKIDETKDPMHLDFYVPDEFVFPLIFRVLSDNKIQIGLGEVRGSEIYYPSSFDELDFDEMFILYKK